MIRFVVLQFLCLEKLLLYLNLSMVSVGDKPHLSCLEDGIIIGVDMIRNV